MSNEIKLQILREIDKLDRIGLDGLKLMLTTGMKDSSGTFNKGVGLTNLQADSIIYFMCLDIKNSDNFVETFTKRIKDYQILFEGAYS